MVLPDSLVRITSENASVLSRAIRISRSYYFRTQNVFIGFMYMFLFEYTVPAASKSFSTSGIDYFDKKIREECLKFYNQGRPWDRLCSRSENSQASLPRLLGGLGTIRSKQGES